MSPKIKNIIIFVVIAVILVLVYLFVFKKDPEVANLSSSPSTDTTVASSGGALPAGSDDFMATLLNVKNITLDTSIFSDPVFNSLTDSTIVLIPDGTEGRPNPFAPIGQDVPRTTTTPDPVMRDPSTSTSVSPQQTTPSPDTTTTTNTGTTTKTTAPKSGTGASTGAGVTTPAN